MYSLFDDNSFLILGHRGFSAAYPENTIESFRACARDSRIDGVELDVHMCKTGEIVVSHDGSLKRCAGIDRFIEDMAWEDLKDIDVGSWKDPSFSNCRLPLLSDLFEEFGSRFCYDIELKVEPGRKWRRLCIAVWELVKSYGLEDRVMVSSFNPMALRKFNKVCWVSVPTANIFSCHLAKHSILDNGWGHKVSNSSYLKPDCRQVDDSFNDKHNKKGLDLICWTVNDTETAARLSKTPHVKGLIGNDPILLAEAIGRKI